MKKIVNIEEKNIEEVLNICALSFAHIQFGGVEFYIDSIADWNISKMLVVDDKIVGCYVLSENDITSYIDNKVTRKYRDLNGVEGVALCVLPDHRDKGYGKLLREVPFKMGYDYIWGKQLTSLKNERNWINYGREVVDKTDAMIVTAMLTKKNFSKLHRYQNNFYTCGPTAVQMVAEYLDIEYGNIDYLIDICNCNSTTGTIDTGIANALDKLSIKNEHIVGLTKEESFKCLDSCIKNSIFVMRALVQGVKHWIVVYGFNYSTDKYQVADSWLGLVEYTSEELDVIWSPRNYDGFIIKK